MELMNNSLVYFVAVHLLATLGAIALVGWIIADQINMRECIERVPHIADGVSLLQEDMNDLRRELMLHRASGHSEGEDDAPVG